MRLAALLVFACVLPSAAAAQARGVPAVYQGSWKGTGSQSDQPGVEWTIALTLADGAAGSVVGTITYPSLTCGGDLILRDTQTGWVELQERITFGTCVDRGVVTLSPNQRIGGLGFDWREDNGSLTARGTLARATPPEP